MTTNLTALAGAIKLVADAAKDASSMTTGAGTLGAIMGFENLVPDVLAVLPEIGDIPAEVTKLTPADYLTLVDMLVTDLAVSNAHAQSIIGPSLTLLKDLVTVVLPDLKALVSAINGPAPAK